MKGPGAHLEPGVCQFVTDDMGMVATLTHADVLDHAITAAAMGLPPNVTAILMTANRTAGAGNLRQRPQAAGTPSLIAFAAQGHTYVWARGLDGDFWYHLTVANDSFDIYIVGYWIRVD